LKILLAAASFADCHGIEIALRAGVIATVCPLEDRGFGAPDWFVVRTKTRKEDVAKVNLERRGVQVFLPRMREFGRRRMTRVTPLFPGYLFVNVSLLASYYRVVWTPGVRTFVAFGEHPTPVQSAVIALLRGSGDANDVIETGPRFQVGDHVHIKDGPFAGLIAIIERPCSPRGRVRVLLDFLRQGTRVDLPAGSVERV
jgi:transcription elongation factor/antiterminator RfaH